MYVIKTYGQGTKKHHKAHHVTNHTTLTRMQGGSLEDFKLWVSHHGGSIGAGHMVNGVEIPYFYEYFKRDPQMSWPVVPNESDKTGTDYLSRVLKLMGQYTYDKEGSNTLSDELKQAFIDLKRKVTDFSKQEHSSEIQELRGKQRKIAESHKAALEDSVDNRYRAWKLTKIFRGHILDTILGQIMFLTKDIVEKATDFAKSILGAAGQGEIVAGADTVQNIGNKLIDIAGISPGDAESMAKRLKEQIDAIRTPWSSLSPSEQQKALNAGFDPNKKMGKGYGLGWGLKKNKDVVSILFSKDMWTTAKARGWLEENGFLNNKVEISEDKLRYKQKESKGGRFATKKLPGGIELVLEYPMRGSDNPIKGMGLLPPWPSDAEMKRMDLIEIKELVPNTITADPVPLSKSEIEQIASRLNKLPINQQLAAASQWQPGVLNYLRTMKNEYNRYLQMGHGLYGGSAGDMDKKKMISRLYKIIDELNARKGKLMKENANQAVIQDIEDEIQEAQHYIDIHGSGLSW
jgi:hypothetical protein